MAPERAANQQNVLQYILESKQPERIGTLDRSTPFSRSRVPLNQVPVPAVRAPSAGHRQLGLLVLILVVLQQASTARKRVVGLRRGTFGGRGGRVRRRPSGCLPCRGRVVGLARRLLAVQG